MEWSPRRHCAAIDARKTTSRSNSYQCCRAEAERSWAGLSRNCCRYRSLIRNSGGAIVFSNGFEATIAEPQVRWQTHGCRQLEKEYSCLLCRCPRCGTRLGVEVYTAATKYAPPSLSLLPGRSREEPPHPINDLTNTLDTR
jgi:hypothetical protein